MAKQIQLDAFKQQAEPLRALGIRVYQKGEEVGAFDFEVMGRRNIYSVSKSFCSSAVGIAIEEGVLKLDEKIVDLFPEHLPKEPNENLKSATLRDCLTMCLGLEDAFLMSADRSYHTEEDWIALSLARPFTYAPNTHFCYNNVGPYLIGLVIQQRTGENLMEYLYSRMLKPMGIFRTGWECDPQGRTFGGSGMFLNLDEIHKLGKLYLHEGQWEGKQLVPADWVKEASRKQVDNGQEGYGYFFWRGRENSFRADGMYGQYSIVLPDKEAVVSVIAESRQAGTLLNTIFDTVCNQL
ncbi:MAG: beta-lactamase family protein [Lachnospiraceae bacterium]|nr:beta-lactamase family protein [Lachnospiraceae bacterium]